MPIQLGYGAKINEYRIWIDEEVYLDYYKYVLIIDMDLLKYVENCWGGRGGGHISQQVQNDLVVVCNHEQDRDGHIWFHRLSSESILNEEPTIHHFF